ncbi:homoserine kinase-like [Telopea speciosissima]|uniref:homoserine kinase-like n=1 Tax=Telopea speciosissima TaxID=54955 RepID=UPI001CC67AE0|nr:homoserine kinase-like [Telopea speciosissima]
MTFRRNPSYYDRPLTAFKIEPEPIFSYVKSFAPATIANVGPGSNQNQVNCAIDGSIGNYVSVRIDPEVTPGTPAISDINGVIPKGYYPEISSAALQVMTKLGIKTVGLSLSIEKGLPPSWSIESKAATDAAVLVAVNELFGRKLSVSELIQAGVDGLSLLEWEDPDYQVFFIGNLMTVIMGSFVMIHRHLSPLEINPLEFPAEKELFFIFVNPEIDIENSCRQEMGASIKETQKDYAKTKTKPHSSEYCGQNAPLIPGFEVIRETAEGKAMRCRIIKNRVSDDDDDDYLEKVMEESKSKIPGLAKVMKVALEEGAFGCKLVGPKVIVAVIDDMEKGKEIGYRMVEAFLNHGGGLKASAMVHKLDRVGARVISRE